MDVGVRELKANLSSWLDRAASGEIVRVTDRGVPKAILAPLPGRLHLDDGVAEGWVRPGSGTALGPVRRARPSGAPTPVLRDDRAAGASTSTRAPSSNPMSRKPPGRTATR